MFVSGVLADTPQVAIVSPGMRKLEESRFCVLTIPYEIMNNHLSH